MRDRIALAHNPVALEKRWRALARKTRMEMCTLCVEEGLPIYLLRHPQSAASIYLSAGVHGDEPAGVVALLEWAETHSAQLDSCWLVPCLNPWGVRENSRLGARGHDLNREWHRRRHVVVRAVKSALGSQQFDLALTLHEDYDAAGFYIYEPGRRGAKDWSAAMLGAVEGLLPVDGRRMIDGRRVPGTGYIQKFFKSEHDLEGPEAIYLHFHHSARTFTIETPSEFALDLRVETQLRLIRTAIGLAAGERC